MELSENIFALENVSFGYGGKSALSIDNLFIKRSSIVGLMGPNGSGKSTLLKLLAFVEKPSEGRILFNGKPGTPFSDSVRFQVTLLNQDPYLMKRSVFDNVAYGLKLRGENGALEKRVREALGIVGLAPEFAQRHWRELSGGETQRVALAARLALEPKVLLLDEPTASVDALSGQFIKEASLNARNNWGTTLVIASHDLQWLQGICDETLHLFNGRIFGTGLETLLFGPWRPLSGNAWGKILENGTRILVTPPPHPEAAGILTRLEIYPADSKNGKTFDNRLNGFVSRLIFQKSTKDIVATVVAGNAPFTLKIPRKNVSELELYPGKEVVLAFDSDDVKWIDS